MSEPVAPDAERGAPPANRIRERLPFDSSQVIRSDPTTTVANLSPAQWDRLSGQRDVMIKAMVAVFTWLNGGVFAFTLAAWAAGIWYVDYRIVTEKTLLALIGATV